MIRFLKYINSMPFRFTMRHYQIFGEATGEMKDKALASPESWDALRKKHPFFSIPDTREEWIAVSELKVKKDGQDKDLIKRAEDTVRLLQEEGIRKIFSVGVGGGGLEYQIKKMMPEVEVSCSDYSPVTVSRLKNVFTEASAVVQFDIMKGNWAEVNQKYIGENGICLMYRIDASFSDAEWCSIFQKMHEAGIRRVLYIPTGMLTMLSIYNRKSREVRWHFKRIPIVWSGYVRTRKRFEQYWSGRYTQHLVTLGGLRSFLLTKM